ncbi:hypothetical protein BJX63DRAFT_398153 [Aspergillus granulosus]|uniref:Uncharacterized protein n=1 Tax=Aspergillus granulosus TaxID=176169 RepID=A0ABR4H907_9EURO
MGQRVVNSLGHEGVSIVVVLGSEVSRWELVTELELLKPGRHAGVVSLCNGYGGASLPRCRCYGF